MKNSIVKYRKTIVKIIVMAMLLFLIGNASLFVFANANTLANILNNNPEKEYRLNDIEISRWTALEKENTFCSENDPIIIFREHNGFILSIALNITELEGTPSCRPKIYWTDAEHPSFSEDCSRVLSTKTSESVQVVNVGRYVKDFRLDLYDKAGAKIRIDSFVVNPRIWSFPTELIFPLSVMSVLLSIYLCVYRYKAGLSIEAGPKRKKIEELDFIRAVCAIGVILYHVSCYIPNDVPKLFYNYANGSFGSACVGIFFLISGGVMYYNYREVEKPPIYYYKRWKTIFPMFYVTYLYFYIREAIEYNTLFYKGTPQKLLLTLVGLDGYLSYKYSNYYIVGEWFLGAIVLLYILYPVYAKLVNKMGWKMLLFVVPMVLWQFNTDWFEIYKTRNLIYCSTMFITGMLIFRYNLYENVILKILSCCISLVVLFARIPELGLFASAISYVFMFFALYLTAHWMIKIPVLKSVFSFIGGLSFPMFLVQNRVIIFLTKSITVSKYSELVKVMLLAIGLSMLCAWCIKIITQGLMRTKWFYAMDKVILSCITKVV